MVIDRRFRDSSTKRSCVLEEKQKTTEIETLRNTTHNVENRRPRNVNHEKPEKWSKIQFNLEL
jgi:hypothetical protein